MKKVITVLAILVVLVGAVFAANSYEAQRSAGTAAINVTAKITEAIPQFQLKINSATDVIAAGKDDVALGTISGSGDNTTVTPVDVTAVSAALASGSITSLTTDNGSVIVGFDINQIAPASLKANYSITVTATDLVLKTYSNGTATGLTMANAGANQHFLVDTTANTTMGASPAITAESGINGLSLSAGSTANVLNASYDGDYKVGTSASDANPLKIGSFSVKWLANTNAVAGDYEATVQMVVASI